jgi:hypothetical protein
MGNLVYITSISEKLAHKPHHSKVTRTEIWTACGKRIRTDRLRLLDENMTTTGGVKNERELCHCAGGTA